MFYTFLLLLILETKLISSHNKNKVLNFFIIHICMYIPFRFRRFQTLKTLLPSVHRPENVRTMRTHQTKTQLEFHSDKMNGQDCEGRGVCKYRPLLHVSSLSFFFISIYWRKTKPCALFTIQSKPWLKTMVDILKNGS